MTARLTDDVARSTMSPEEMEKLCEEVLELERCRLLLVNAPHPMATLNTNRRLAECAVHLALAYREAMKMLAEADVALLQIPAILAPEHDGTSKTCSICDGVRAARERARKGEG